MPAGKLHSESQQHTVTRALRVNQILSSGVMMMRSINSSTTGSYSIRLLPPKIARRSPRNLAVSFPGEQGFAEDGSDHVVVVVVVGSCIATNR